jgi:peroxiredoxin
MIPRTILGGSFGTWGIRPLELLLILFCVAGASRLSAQPSSTRPVNRKPSVGNPAPGFAVSTLDGKVVSLHDYRGKAVVVNFWATWCGNCKMEMPWLAQLREKYAVQGFEVLGILTDYASQEKIAALTRSYGVKYPILMCDHKTAHAYGGLPDLPESFFIDRRGMVVAEMDGADSKQQIEADIRKALLR